MLLPTLTVTHEAPLELIRQHPSLALGLLGNAHERPGRVELVDRVIQQARQRVRAL
jgi:hypothetical protein